MAGPHGTYQYQEAPPSEITTTEGFDVLIERAASLLVVCSSEDVDEEPARNLREQAIKCITEAARTPFFGGARSTIEYESLDLVRELVFERVRDELVRRGYPVPKNSAISSFG